MRTGEVLSERRARAVATELMFRGISTDQLQTLGRGKGYPVESSRFAYQCLRSSCRTNAAGRKRTASDLPMCADVQITFRRASNILSRQSQMTDADAVLTARAP
jgi:hypothetical protein